MEITAGSTRLETRRLSELKPHPLNAEIYGDDCTDDLIESIQRQGVSGVTILPDGTIVSGHRRVKAARQLGIQKVEVTVRPDLIDEWDVLEAVLDYNSQREKTTEQRLREFKTRKVVESKKASDRLSKGGGDRKSEEYSYKSGSANLHYPIPSMEQGKAEKLAAEKAGLKQTTARKGSVVIDAADQLRKKGDNKKADQLISTLNQSVDKAHKVVKAEGLPTSESIGEDEDNKSNGVLRIEEVKTNDGRTLFIQHRPGSQLKFTRTNEMVDWAWWTWNPITGCWHGCNYCYARDIANRRYATKFEPTFHPDRLTCPANTKVPNEAAIDGRAKNVFVCSMADLFGKWVPEEGASQFCKS